MKENVYKTVSSAKLHIRLDHINEKADVKDE